MISLRISLPEICPPSPQRRIVKALEGLRQRPESGSAQRRRQAGVHAKAGPHPYSQVLSDERDGTGLTLDI